MRYFVHATEFSDNTKYLFSNNDEQMYIVIGNEPPKFWDGSLEQVLKHVKGGGWREVSHSELKEMLKSQNI